MDLSADEKRAILLLITVGWESGAIKGPEAAKVVLALGEKVALSLKAATVKP